MGLDRGRGKPPIKLESLLRTGTFKLPAKIHRDSSFRLQTVFRVLALEQIRIGVEYLFNRVHLFVTLDLSRLRGIERSPRLEEYIQQRLSRAAAVQFHSCREGALVARGRETRLPRIPMHLHNCAYKFRTLPEGFGWLIAGLCLRQCCTLRFLVRRFRILSE